LPVIGAKEGGVPETILPNQTGILIDPIALDEIKKAIDHLLDDATWKNFVTEARKFYNTTYAHGVQKEKIKAVFGNLPNDIAVVIPAYNSEKTIGDCLTSLSLQIVQPQEIIVIDDGSTDKTVEIASKFPGVQVVSQKNAGAPVARNRGAKETSSPFLIFLDSDITLSPHMLLYMRRELALNPLAAFCYSGFKFGWKKFPSVSFSAKKLATHNYIHTSSLIRREHFPKFDENLKRHQDWDLWLTIAKNGEYGVWIPETLYTIHPQKKRISTWVPSFTYRLPFANILPSVREYNKSADIIKKKHFTT